MPSVLERAVRELVAELLGVCSDELVGEVSLRDELALDSLDLVELGMALEDAFAIAVPASLLERMRSYGDIVRATTLLVRARGGEQLPAFA